MSHHGNAAKAQYKMLLAIDALPISRAVARPRRARRRPRPSRTQDRSLNHPGGHACWRPTRPPFSYLPSLQPGNVEPGPPRGAAASRLLRGRCCRAARTESAPGAAREHSRALAYARALAPTLGESRAREPPGAAGATQAVQLHTRMCVRARARALQLSPPRGAAKALPAAQAPARPPSLSLSLSFSLLRGPRQRMRQRRLARAPLYARGPANGAHPPVSATGQPPAMPVT